MYILTLKTAAKVTAEPRSHGGHEYLVAPVIALVEGVVNGELAPGEEIGAFVGAWKGIPFVLDHPVDVNNEPISANDPDVLLETAVGTFFNPTFDGEKLRGEVWVDIAKAEAIGGDAIILLEKLRAGEPVEVSTAYWREVEDRQGEYKGKTYSGVQRKIRPDHLAALLHQQGACSWADGCGVPRLNKEGIGMTDQVVNVLGKARRPTYKGTSDTAWSAPSLDQWLSAYPGEAPDTKQVEELPAGVKSWIAAHTLLGDPKADNFRDLAFFPVVGTDGKLNAGAVRAVLSGRGTQANIPAAAKESAQSVARSLLDKEFKAQSCDEGCSQTLMQQTVRLMAQLVGLNINQEESKVERAEIIKKLLADHDVGLTEDELNTLEDDALKRMLAKLSAKGPEGGDDDAAGDGAGKDDDAKGEPTGEGEGKGEGAGDGAGNEPPADQKVKTKAPEIPESLQKLAKAVEDRGGIDAVLGVIDKTLTREAAERDQVVKRIASNSKLVADDLKGLSLDSLKALDQALLPADYSGCRSLATQSEGEIKPFAMPPIHEKPAD